MKIRIGDKVKFLNEIGEGVVTRLKDKTTVFVEMNDGFEIPYPVSQLVPIHTELILNKDTENIELEPDVETVDAIYFVVEPDHALPVLTNDYNLYLFNASSFNLLYSYSIKDEAYYQTLKHGEVGAFQKVLLKQVKLNFFKDFNTHKVCGLLFKNTHYKLQQPIYESIQINPRSLNPDQLIEHQEFKHPVYAFLLKDDFASIETVEDTFNSDSIIRLKTVKEFKSQAKASKSSKAYLKSLEKEIDLHIEELVKNPDHLTSHEKLSIQLEKVEKELDNAIANGLRKLTFIHGVGNGRLKQEIIHLLKTIKGIQYHDAPYKIYGYGATEVLFF
ncbi:MAG: Smr/MutS family protein [Sediminibacterium sp.]|nr:Smr/MutS family protein [Sediminibacterium sp.]